jgi:hypothetical protein
MKEKYNKDIEKSQEKRTKQNPGNTKSLQANKNTVESYFSRLEQVEGRN